MIANINLSLEKDRRLKPILIIENLTKDYGIPSNKRENKDKTLTQNEEILLTLIANIIVEIIIREEI